MTFLVDMLNIPPDILNIYPTSSTSPSGDLQQRDVEDVEDVEPKKNLLETYLLSVIKLGAVSLHAVKPPHGRPYPCTYPALNILNIPNTFRVGSLCVHKEPA